MFVKSSKQAWDRWINIDARIVTNYGEFRFIWRKSSLIKLKWEKTALKIGGKF